MSSNLSEKVKVIQGRILSLLNKKEELEKMDIMYANCLNQTKEKTQDLKKLEEFMFHDKLNINDSIIFFAIGELLIYLFFLFELCYILFSSNGIFTLPILETIFYNALSIVMFNIFNKALKVSKKAKEINLNYFGDTIYDSKRIKERKEFFHLERKRLLQKRLEIEKEVSKNDMEIEDLKSLLKDVVSTWSDNKQDNNFFQSTFMQGNFMQQFVLRKRR